jgi:hypothetical protein
VASTLPLESREASGCLPLRGWAPWNLRTAVTCVPVEMRVLGCAGGWPAAGRACSGYLVADGATRTPDVAQHVLADFVFKRLNVIT